MGAKTRYESWQRVASQVMGNVEDTQWQHADRVGDIGDVSPKIFRRAGMCTFPLDVKPRMARDWSDLWNIASLRRMGRFGWAPAPQRGRLLEVHPSLGMYWSVAAKNLDRLRRRWVRARASPLSETTGPMILDDGSVSQVAPGGEAIPVGQHFPLPSSSPFDSANSNFAPTEGDDRDGSVANLQTAERPRVDLEPPPLRRACTSL